MKKSIIALSASVVLSVHPGSASAQTAVTLYGVLDAGIDVQSPSSSSTAGNQSSLQSGISTPSRIGIKGVDDVGASLKVLFEIEAGVQIDRGDSSVPGTLFNRASWVGLSGDFGTVLVGRQLTPLYSALYSIDPFELGMAGNAGNLMHLGGGNLNGTTLVGGNNLMLENGGGSTAQNNSLRYNSHDWNGFSTELNYGFASQSDSISRGSETGATLYYRNGPLLMLASYDGINNLNDSHKFQTTLVGGSIDWSEFGLPVKTNIGYATNKGTDLIGGALTDSSNLLLGLRIPVGPHEVLFSYIHNTDNNYGLDANQIALGYTYALSNRTTLYSSIGEIFNKNSANYTLGNASNTGYGVRGFDLGLRHSF